ncbi:energy-coupling factor transport system ATP-binding protein [Alkalithermobacter thermoalcaliphilus JW-YL-7 = DSM 7308]|uniref:Energy-coupling factor transporter ATP-binding protein EcfA2 n=1 Tax=Alkalithermobacter thermoalcaliphilus JW-YL-7 = DSM 7308 TaxID=1121328 RepID=A0A150FMZ4_CLOPD|nr:cobalt ABC transporter, ATPase subunit [[Clostridium] paradoxum JW-YL-7 = DSM 7308]SHL24213.1 energy-coupling factor transport system ATP-binding protein [[Clostridium] paradoxum JW-YL-7 = DSM 7308]
MSISIKNLKHVYNQNTPFESLALDDINLEIQSGELVGLIGHTGSGKSTLIQHLNGILKPTSGKIFIDDVDITDENISLSNIRKKVGVVFQYPEYQLFEETVYKDIAFGPSNLGLSEDEINKRVIEAMKLVGLNYEQIKDRSPFELSGGQKRRVAIAGVLAMKPKILVLDEPTAGLDPKGRDEILSQIKDLHKNEKMTIILSSHSMEDMAKIATKIVVMAKGKVYMQGKAKEVFMQADKLKSVGLDVPLVCDLVKKLRQNGFNIREDIITIQEAKEEIIKYMRGKKI